VSTDPGGTDSDSTDSDAVGTPLTDPWKGLRGVMAGTLVLEAIVVLLAIPVVATVGGGPTAGSTVYLVGLALAMIVASGMQRRPYALKLNLALQAVMIAGFVVHPAIGSMGVLFAVVWAYILWLRRDIARRMERGLLPGQRNTPGRPI